ncbi:response regulator [Azospirillum sp.]|uniref:response regulator n=1 Tax=Azospirillum sp. TaxID=34012 RepID=UPI003D722855
MAPLERPAPLSGIADAYDVDALLVELGAEPQGDEAALNVCLTLEELYAPRSRFQMAEELGEFLDPRRITPTELLHTVEPQRAFADWRRRDLVLERVAQAQALPGRRTATQRREELAALEGEALAVTAQRAHRGDAPAFDARTFASAVSKIAQATRGFAARYAVDALVASWLAGAVGWELKLDRLLSLVSDALPPLGEDAIDQIIGEILASDAGAGELFGWVEGLRASLEVLAQLWRGDTVTHPRAPAAVRRLNAYIASHEARGARRGLEITLHRALTGDGRLCPPTGGDPRATSIIVDELVSTSALAVKLRGRGTVMGGERTMHLLDRRAARNLTGDRLEMSLRGKSHYARIVDLLTYEGAAFGELCRKMVTAALRTHLDHRDFTQRLFESARTPRARIKALSDVQARLLRSGLPDALKDRYARMLDEIQSTYLRTNRILARVARDRSPTVDEVMEYATLLAEGAFTEGKCAAAARELVGFHVRTTAFLRAFLQRRKDEAERRAERFATFFGTLQAAGIPMRDMATLRVLLVDDEPQARSYVEMILRDLGIADIVLAEDGREALEAFDGQETLYDLVICDWKMPRVTGLEFLKQVRSVRPEMPFLMVTALATMIAVEEALAHDVTAYIAKPFSPEHLEEKILVLVNR